ncbi:hypothetical protein [Nocardia iowensis]|uniref:Uncharacterized protein n=1 Tax=Nocardia iowensis TaxID=204891 RepID=A0ABX8RYM8_NOCIO|nr:hypothetical protein [Nocardia iowensis]QXN94769.1 hypothetical protein KV110_17995 [Nocardia iowensis]
MTPETELRRLKDVLALQQSDVEVVGVDQGADIAASLRAAGLGFIVDGLALMDVTEDEIAKAQIRHHPRLSDLLWHSSSLLKPTHPSMFRSEFVYRAHCRELLDRVAAGTPTEYGTAAEVCLAVLAVATVTPINTAAMGLHLRMWKLAGLPALGGPGENLPHYEAIAGSKIDDLETTARKKLRVEDRVLGDIRCCGQHNGVHVRCEYASVSRIAAA